MGKKWIKLSAAVLAVVLLAGCNMRTVEQLYAPPRRPEAYDNLQSQIDRVMPGMEYQAPLTGENRQAIQTADLDGDGQMEYLLFAKRTGDKPLQIYIFSANEEGYVLLDTIESTGSAVDLVEYAQMDNRPGAEIVVGRQLSDQLPRSVSVYTLQDGQIQQLLSANYSKIVCTDLDGDLKSELLLLRPGHGDSDTGVAELYSVVGGSMERSPEVSMSEPASAIKRIMVGKLDDGLNAVYVASDVDGSAIITDIYAIVDNKFTNVSLSNESGTSVQTLRNYYVYADDIDEDGVLELPNLITMQLPPDASSVENQYLICWYAMNSRGEKMEELYTYHNYVGGWYLTLHRELAPRMVVSQQGNSYIFSVWDEKFESVQRLLSIYVLTGQKREEQAAMDNRFVLHRTESTVYAANLEVISATYGITKDDIIASFHLILQDWYTGET